MKTCLFCRKTRIFEIHRDYGNNGHTIKDDLIEFFGHQIENHLRSDDVVCNLCMNIMDNVAKLKRRLLPLIFRLEPRNKENCKPIRFGKKWNDFAMIDFDDDIDHHLESRSPSPDLVECKHVQPYVSPVERRIEEYVRISSETRKRSKSAGSGSERSRRGRRKKRGHNWSRRKSSRYSSIDFDQHSIASTYSRAPSTMSLWSRRSSSFPITAEDDDDNVDTNFNESVVIQDIRIYADNMILHECTEDNCQFVCENIDLMSQHKIARHKHVASFRCSVCGKQYTSSDDLKIHSRVHSERRPCPICKREFYEDELKDHWQQYYENSVPCEYCGKRFLDKSVCRRHQKTVHVEKISRRVDYSRNNYENNIEEPEFMVRLLVQDTESNLRALEALDNCQMNFIGR